ncbi:MAG: MmgE/PrpD family protein [Burkholderiales bacterium]|nr:MmgE/PrpD family protein [Burkholderiales bacterium]
MSRRILLALSTEKIPCRIKVKTDDGEIKSASIDHPRGPFKNPMTDEEVATKFMDLAMRSLPRLRAEALLALLWKLDGPTDLEAIFRAACINEAGPPF